MKKTRWKNILRSIRGSINRFLSIMFIVALGAGFMAGLAAASPDMYDSADRYIDEYRLFDIHIKSLIGFSEDAVRQIEEMEETESLQKAIVLDMVLDQDGGSDFTSRVYGILDEHSETELNRIRLTEGRLPENPSECVVESVFGRYSGEQIHPGDVLRLSDGNTGYGTLRSQMSDTVLTVVGICESPMCISIEGDTTNIGAGTINLNVYVQKSFFTTEYDTDLYLTVSGASGLNTFTDSYEDLIQSVVETLRPLSDSSSGEQAENMRIYVQDQINQAQELVEEVHEIGQIQENLRIEQTQGFENTQQAAELFDGSSSLADALRLPSGNSENKVSAYELEETLQEQIDAALAMQQLLENSTWIFQTRDGLAGFDSYHNNVGKVSALAKVFPVFFFIVALLVALTTMTRLVEENRLQIGTLKALGYSNGQILMEYMLFSLLASVCGCIIGLTAGFFIFPTAINSAYKMMYMLPSMETPFRWEIAVWVAPVTILSILLAAIWSCWNEFRSMPSVLMSPKAPAPGKRIWLEHIKPVWRRLSFTRKVTFRNLFRYKKRFIMTMIGVAGCSALLLTGFGVKDSVNDILDKQFGEIFHYDMLFIGSEESFQEKDRQVADILSDSSKIQYHMMACQETGRIYVGNNSQDISLLVPEDPETFSDYVELRSRTSRETYSLSSEGVILTEKLCEEMHIHVGDTVILEDSDGHQGNAIVSAITENYVYSFAYMTSEYYQKLFPRSPSITTLVCVSAEGSDIASTTSEILASPYVLFGRSTANLRETFAESIQSINGVIYVLIIAAGLLCIVVLYNLTNVNICERRKELATLQVLGFYPSETQNYIFRETNILSFLGALVGLGIGVWFHSYVIKTVEVNHIMFGREISFPSYLIALGITIVFTLLTDLIMKRPINRTDMVEAMKAND